MKPGNIVTYILNKSRSQYGLTSYGASWDGNTIIWFLRQEGRNAILNFKASVVKTRDFTLTAFMILAGLLALFSTHTVIAKFVSILFVVLGVVCFASCTVLIKYLKNLTQEHHLYLGLNFSGGAKGLPGGVLRNINAEGLTQIMKITKDPQLTLHDYKNMEGLVSDNDERTLFEILHTYRKLMHDN